jgi:hypothetical protein
VVVGLTLSTIRWTRRPGIRPYGRPVLIATRERDTMKAIVLSALLAGFIAGFVWMAITVLVGGYGKGGVVGGGFGFLVGTAIVAGIISALVRRSKRGAPA